MPLDQFFPDELRIIFLEKVYSRADVHYAQILEVLFAPLDAFLRDDHMGGYGRPNARSREWAAF